MLIEDGNSKCISTDSLFGDAKCCSCVQKCALCEAAIGLCGVNTTLDTKGAQQKEKCQSPPESEPITGCERRQRCLCACCCVCSAVCVRVEEGKENDIQRCTKHMHPFTDIINTLSRLPITLQWIDSQAVDQRLFPLRKNQH